MNAFIILECLNKCLLYFLIKVNVYYDVFFIKSFSILSVICFSIVMTNLIVII